MYGVVLMMALSAGAEMPAWNDVAGEHVARYGDHGQKEYRGGRRCGGGCYGGYCGGNGGCYGGWGGCYGGGYGGCYGGWSGRYGGWGSCYGGWGSCSGGWGYGCYGGYGGYGYGGYYGYSPYGTFNYSGSQPSNYYYGIPPTRGDSTGDYNTPNTGQVAPRADGMTPARLLVRLPADATLSIEGSPTTSTQGVRSFISPPLQPGRDYLYTLKAEVMRDGKRVERTKDVSVHAGEQSEVTIDLP
jgi:uncharacterized protein (TIGR03000 family)